MIIREYRPSDFDALVLCLDKLQDHVASLDPFHWERSGADFDPKAYISLTLQEVSEQEGAIFVAEDDGKIVGCIVGKMAPHSPLEQLECFTTRQGKIAELFVDEEARGKKVGSLLMQRIEDYFRSKQCDAVTVECFAPNTGAHTFYESCGYSDRTHILLKKL